jgi:Flp pilus assembly protein TadB
MTVFEWWMVITALLLLAIVYNTQKSRDQLQRLSSLLQLLYDETPRRQAEIKEQAAAREWWESEEPKRKQAERAAKKVEKWRTWRATFVELVIFTAITAIIVLIAFIYGH